MTIEDKYRVYQISFDSWDFQTGVAQEVIKMIKELPKGGKKYYDKRWTIYKDKLPEEFYQKLMDMKYEPRSEAFEDGKDFDVEKYMNSKFGVSISQTYEEKRKRKEIEEKYNKYQDLI